MSPLTRGQISAGSSAGSERQSQDINTDHIEILVYRMEIKRNKHWKIV